MLKAIERLITECEQMPNMAPEPDLVEDARIELDAFMRMSRLLHRLQAKQRAREKRQRMFGEVG